MGKLRYTNLPSDTSNKDALTQLALDVTSTWSGAADALWSQVNRELWERTRNPWVVVRTVSGKRLEEITTAPAFRGILNELLRVRSQESESPRWFQQSHQNSPLKSVAYFSMEYMLSEALPIYSGGLGNVAGDQLKAADDLGVPVVAIGLLYQQGYFRQEIDLNGAQQALYPFNDPGQLPIKPLREPNGEWLRLPVTLSGIKVWIRTWQAQVGRTMLYLLDSNDPANPPAYQGITSELYGGGPDLRIRQEAMLGIGGWRLLRALGLRPEVCHLNEGHAAFAVLERARSYMLDNNQPFDVALAITRAGNLFTTHTPVEAGFDRFAPALMEKYFKNYSESRLNIPLHDLLALGRRNANDDSEPFNMANLALRGCGAVNGVSRLHGEVSRRIFQPLFPRWPQREVPVGHVTNGVHAPTWDSADADSLWTSACGKHRWRGAMEARAPDVRRADDSRLWQLRATARRCLVEYTRNRLARQRATPGASQQ